jgi:regulatory protein
MCFGVASYDIFLMKSQNSDNSKNIKLAKRLSERYLRNAGEYYLNRFPASSAHFLIVMTRKIDKSCRDHPDQTRETWITHVRDVVTPYFENLGLLNDDLYSKAVFNSLKNKGYSAAKIKSRMIQKSISSDHINECLNDGFKDSEAVEIFARKKRIGKYRPTPYANHSEKQKDLGKLARAGFSYDLAMRILEKD